MPQNPILWSADETDAEPPVREDPSFLDRMGGLKGLAAGVTRAIGGYASMPGGWYGAGMGGGSEVLAQMIEEGSLKAPFEGEGTSRILAEAGMGAIPFAKVFRAGQPVLASAIRGAAYSGGGEAMREAARDDGTLDPVSILGHTALGAGTAGALARFLKAPATVVNPYVVEPTAQRGGQVISGLKKGPKVVPTITPHPIPKGAGVPLPSGLGLEPKAPVAYGGVPAEASGRVQKILSKEEKIKQALEDSFVTALAKKGQRLNEVGTKEIMRDQRMLEKMLRGVDDIPPGTAPAAPRSPDLIPGQPPAPPENPFVAAAVRASERAAPGAGGVAPVVEAPFNPPRFAPPVPPVAVPAPAPAGFSQPGLGPLFQTAEGSTISQGMAPALTDAEFLAAVRKPVEAAGPSALARFFKSPVDVLGQAYRGAQAAEGVNPLATRQLGIGLQQEARRAGLPTRGGGNLEKFLQEKVSPEISGTREVVPRAPVEAPRAERARFSPTAEFGTDVTTAADKLAGASSARTMTPAEVQEQLSFIDRIKKMGSGGERGGVAPELATRLGLGAAGALIGGATDPLDNPLLSAAAGGALGLAAPSAIKLLQRAKIDPTLGPDEQTITGLLQTPEGISTLAKNVWETLPQYFRANYLLNPNLVNNVISGPFGAGVTGAAEAHLIGDPRGAALLRALRPDNWAREFTTTWNEAQQLLGATERAGGELVGLAPTAARRALAVPGTFMTMGDVTTRRIGERVGFTADEMRRMTMTNEPEFNFMRRLADIPRGSTVGQIALPFSRTLANIVEQGSMRLPGIGSLVQANRAVPDPLKTQLVQQAMGGAAGLAGGAAGYYAPEDPIALGLTRGFASNIAGRSALPAAMGFVAGRAMRQGEPARVAAERGITEGFRSLPLPTTETPEEWARFIFAEPGNRVLPRSAVPGLARDLRFGRRGGTPPVGTPGIPGQNAIRWEP